MVHEFPKESVGSKSSQSYHVGLLVFDRMLNIVPYQPQMLPLFQVVLGFFLIFQIHLKFLLSSLLASLMINLVQFQAGEIFKIFPNCGILHVILNKVSLSHEPFTFIFLLCVSCTIDEVQRHFLVVNHLFNLKFNSFLMLDRIS